MSASVSCLPIWKKDSTAAEWLQEMAAIALAFPERFERVVVIFEEIDDKKRPWKTRSLSRNIDSNTDLLGTMESAKLELFEYMKGRRT